MDFYLAGYVSHARAKEFVAGKKVELGVVG